MEETNEPPKISSWILECHRENGSSSISNAIFHMIIDRLLFLESERVGLVVSKEQTDQIKALVGAYGQYCSDQTENWRDGKSISFKDLWDNLDWTVDHVFEVLGLEVEQKETDKT